MKKIQKFAVRSLAVAALLGAVGCSGMSTQDKYTAGGAATGAVAGAVVTGGSTLGTVGGGVIGGIIGHEVGKNR